MTPGQGAQGRQRPSPLIRKTLIKMVLRVSAVMLASAAVSYIHVMRNLEQQTRSRLEQYIQERGEKESAVFLLTEQNHSTLKQEFLSRLAATSNQNFQDRFSQLFRVRPDGTLRTERMLYEGKPEPDGSVVRYLNGVIFEPSILDENLRRQVVVAYDLLTDYGPALRKELEAIYTFIPDGSGMAYSPNVAWNLEAPVDKDFSQEEWAYSANRVNNPDRETVWTGVYYEPVSGTYLVSCITPIDVSGYKPFAVGSDISVNQLVEKTVQDHLDGAYNIIFRTDGRLIAHPQLMKEIEAQHGNLTIQATGDAQLQRIYQLVINAAPDQHVLINEYDREYLAVSQIPGPDWFLVTVYPKALLSGFALKTVQFILISGLAGLLIETGLLFSVLRQQIAKPFHQLIEATDRIANGDFNIHLDINRRDELGHLATSFNSMATELEGSFLALEKANLELEQRVEERTFELKNILNELQRTQGQIIQSEKMSALGQMVAGIAHEINNPINFIHNNLDYVERYTQDLLQLITAYQQEYTQPSRSLQQLIDTVEVDFITNDLSKTLQSMKVGTERICEIIKSLRNFSRLDEAEYKAVDIHDGIENTLLILRHRLKATPKRADIRVVKDYGPLPLVECYAGQLNQVFMNILSNAIDALEERDQRLLLEEDSQISEEPNTIWIRTEVIHEDWISIQIADNGLGMGEATQSSIFDPFFTTKTVGKGTGLGLSISYRIITEKHGGRLLCESAVGQGTRFVIRMPIHQRGMVTDLRPEPKPVSQS